MVQKASPTASAWSHVTQRTSPVPSFGPAALQYSLMHHAPPTLPTPCFPRFILVQFQSLFIFVASEVFVSFQLFIFVMSNGVLKLAIGAVAGLARETKQKQFFKTDKRIISKQQKKKIAMQATATAPGSGSGVGAAQWTAGRLLGLPSAFVRPLVTVNLPNKSPGHSGPVWRCSTPQY